MVSTFAFARAPAGTGKGSMTQVFSRGKTGIGDTPAVWAAFAVPNTPLIGAIHQLDHSVQDWRRRGQVVQARIRGETAYGTKQQHHQSESKRGSETAISL